MKNTTKHTPDGVIVFSFLDMQHGGGADCARDVPRRHGVQTLVLQDGVTDNQHGGVRFDELDLGQ